MKSKRLILIISAVALVTLASFCLSLVIGEDKTAYNFFAFDTAGTVTLYDSPDRSGKLFSNIRDTVNMLDKKLNGFSEDSSLSSLNISRRSSDKALIDIIKKSKELYERYGYTDITTGGLIYLWNISDGGKTVPDDNKILSALDGVNMKNVLINGDEVTLSGDTEIELGAVAKGYALDKLNELLIKDGIKNAVIDLGSSVLLFGEDRTFTVDIKSPFKGNETVGRLYLSQSFVSTSGGYERFTEVNGKKYSHILDPETGYPVKSDLASVTVVCENGILSDFLSTSIYIMGKDKLVNSIDRLRKDGVEVIAVCENGEILVSEGIKNNFNAAEDSRKITMI